jgi:hypothetical protein
MVTGPEPRFSQRSPVIVPGKRPPSARYMFIFGLAAMIWLVNGVWLDLDTRPPVWDMALHQTYALNYWQFLRLQNPEATWYDWSGNYPPFVHFLIACWYFFFHPSPHVAVLANIPATILLLWALYELTLELAGEEAARWACFITATTPFLMWLSRETTLDYWLSSWVAISLLLLQRTEGFRNRTISISFGLSIAFGLLTKWMFAGWVIFPLLYVIRRHRVLQHRDRRFHLTICFLCAVLVAGVWYLPNLPRLLTFFRENMRIGELEGDPPVFSLQSLIYYLRLLEGYQLFAILFAIMLVSCIVVWKRRLIPSGAYFGTAIGGGWLIMTLLRTKDPRFTMPLLGLLAIVPGAWIQDWKSTWKARAAKVILAAVLIFQAYLVNFGVSWLPERIVLAHGYQGSLQWDWNLYTQDVFGILGRPRRENWQLKEVLLEMVRHGRESGLHASLAVIPDLPRFNATSLNLYSRLEGIASRIDHLQAVPTDVRVFQGFDYVVVKDGDQGEPWTTHNNNALNHIILDHPFAFVLVHRFALPDGSLATLFAFRR